MDASKRVRGIDSIGQIGQHVIDLFWEIADITWSFGIGQGSGRALIAARSPANPEINPTWVERLQQAKGFCDLQGTVVRQHHPPTPNADGVGVGCNLADHDLWAGTGKARQIVMLSYPEAP